MFTEESISPWFEEVLACPICKSDVELHGNKLICVNNSCRSPFPVIDGIPVMLVEIDKYHEYQMNYFNHEFKGYEKYQLENWRISYLKRIFRALNIGSNPSDLYLDIGIGGCGYTVIEATRRGCRSVGLDISFEGVKKARDFAFSELGESRSQCIFVVAKAENLPFKNKAFAKVSSVAVLEHVPDDKMAMSEIGRVIKPGGRVFLTIPNSYWRIPPIFWLPYYFWDKKIGHLRHYKAEDLLSEFSRMGFRTNNVLYSGHLVKMSQILLSKVFPSLGKRDSKLWWKLEEMDLKTTSPTGLQLTLLLWKTE
jgi:ubiquinone/menaquinone biosynthesis C-methylase UbiE